MSCKLFLGGVRPGTSEKLLEDHFSRFGPVSEAVVMRDKDFGFVTFENADGADAALSEPQQTIDGQVIDVKPATGKRDRDDNRGDRDRGDRGSGRGGGRGSIDKVFVGGLPQDCSNETIREHFESYGNIVDAIVMKDRDTGRSKGFGFVQFDSADAVDKVIADYDIHKIAGKWVEVKASIPKDEMDANPRGRRDDRGRGMQGSRGGGGGRDSSAYSRDGYHGGAPPPSAYGVAHPGMYGGLPPPPMYGGAYGAAYGAYGYPGYGYPGYGYPCAYGMPPPAGAYGRPSGSGKDEYGAYGAYGAAPPQAAIKDRGSRSSPY